MSFFWSQAFYGMATSLRRSVQQLVFNLALYAGRLYNSSGVDQMIKRFGYNYVAQSGQKRRITNTDRVRTSNKWHVVPKTINTVIDYRNLRQKVALG